MIEKYEEILEKITQWRKLKFSLNSKFDFRKYENLKDLLKFQHGWQPSKDFHIYENKKGYIRFIQNRDYSTSNHITYIPKNRLIKTCGKEDIIMDKYGDAGKVRFGLEGAYNVALMKIIPKEKEHKEYIRDFLNTEFIYLTLKNSSIASTRNSLNEKHFNCIKIPMLNKKDFLKYEFQLNSILKNYLLIKDKIERLTNIKHILLNKYFK
ncbi:restriction endonuclease subunit S [[Mycoplasma] falconis]|uniref:restriction endonuclease subunit S n=1 Tax=[Mycoplasma] falconis TaxID=92403 RepID=UPI0014774F95|nr:restriction endonuclease subunit S [[Mycoplasma] falconis]